MHDVVENLTTWSIVSEVITAVAGTTATRIDWHAHSRHHIFYGRKRWCAAAAIVRCVMSERKVSSVRPMCASQSVMDSVGLGMRGDVVFPLYYYAAPASISKTIERDRMSSVKNVCALHIFLLWSPSHHRLCSAVGAWDVDGSFL